MKKVSILFQKMAINKIYTTYIWLQMKIPDYLYLEKKLLKFFTARKKKRPLKWLKKEFSFNKVHEKK